MNTTSTEQKAFEPVTPNPPSTPLSYRLTEIEFGISIAFLYQVQYQYESEKMCHKTYASEAIPRAQQTSTARNIGRAIIAALAAFVH